MLPAPRPRLDPETVRARLLALAAGDVDDERGGSAADNSAGIRVGGGSASEVVDPGVLRPGAASWRAIAAAIALALAAGWFALQVLRGPEPAPLQLIAGDPPAGASPAAPAPSSIAGPGPSGSAPALLVVHVVGEVRRPGLVRVPAGSRVADAIAAAGGIQRGGSSGSLNLARPVADGEQVDVGPESLPGPAAGPPGTGAATAATAVNLNSATETDLDELPGVGPVLAGRIVAWRAENGRFVSVDQLGEVPGIGERTLQRLAPLVRV